MSSSWSKEHFSAVLAGLGIWLRSSCKEPKTEKDFFGGTFFHYRQPRATQSRVQEHIHCPFCFDPGAKSWSYLHTNFSSLMVSFIHRGTTHIITHPPIQNPPCYISLEHSFPFAHLFLLLYTNQIISPLYISFWFS